MHFMGSSVSASDDLTIPLAVGLSVGIPCFVTALIFTWLFLRTYRVQREENERFGHIDMESGIFLPGNPHRASSSYSVASKHCTFGAAEKYNAGFRYSSKDVDSLTSSDEFVFDWKDAEFSSKEPGVVSTVYQAIGPSPFAIANQLSHEFGENEATPTYLRQMAPVVGELSPPSPVVVYNPH